MTRLNPLNDYVFKKLIGEQGSEFELKSFLSAVLAKELKSVAIIEKELTPEIIGDKLSILDVRATTDDNTQIDIEVQLKNYGDMDKRSLFYWSKMFAKSLNVKEDYIDLPNVVTINILDFNFIELDKFHTVYHIWEDSERYQLTNALEMHFIEMKKFLKLKNKDVNNPLHRWLTFFDENINQNTLKELTNMDNAIKKANDKLTYLSNDKDALHYANLREIAIVDYNSGLSHAKREGKKEKAIEIARNALSKGLPIETIAELTGLDISTIKSLQN